MSRPARSWTWLQGLACGALACLATPTALLGGVLLAPGLAMWLLGGAARRSVATTMLLFGIAASTQSMMELWSHDHTVESAMEILQARLGAILAWTAALGGCLLHQAACLTARVLAEHQSRQEVSALAVERDALLSEWGGPGP